MRGQTHISFGLLVTTYTATNIMDLELTPLHFMALLAISSVGSLLPDIDHSGSTLGSKVPIVSKIFKHRGFTHTVWFLLICVILSFILSIKLKIPVEYLFYFNISILTHLIGDMLTPAGLKIFKIFGIFDFKLRIGILKSGGLLEKGLNYMFLILVPFVVL